MALTLDDLDVTTRRFMLVEVDADEQAGRLEGGTRLTPMGQRLYPGLLRAAITSGTDDDLATDLRAPGMFNQYERRRTKTGGQTVAAVPRNAPDVLAEGEFNRFYLRGLCARLVEEGAGLVEVYRARPSSHPRPESEALIGTLIAPAPLLADLRSRIGVDTALGLPPGPGSGLSGRRAG